MLRCNIYTLGISLWARNRGELAKATDGIEHSLPQSGVVPECILNEFSINFDLHRLNTILDIWQKWRSWHSVCRKEFVELICMLSARKRATRPKKAPQWLMMQSLAGGLASSKRVIGTSYRRWELHYKAIVLKHISSADMEYPECSIECLQSPIYWLEPSHTPFWCHKTITARFHQRPDFFTRFESR